LKQETVTSISHGSSPSLSNAIRYDLLEGKHVEKASEKLEIFNQILKNTEKLEKNEV